MDGATGERRASVRGCRGAVYAARRRRGAGRQVVVAVEVLGVEQGAQRHRRGRAGAAVEAFVSRAPGGGRANPGPRTLVEAMGTALGDRLGRYMLADPRNARKSVPGLQKEIDKLDRGDNGEMVGLGFPRAW